MIQLPTRSGKTTLLLVVVAALLLVAALMVALRSSPSSGLEAAPLEEQSGHSAEGPCGYPAQVLEIESWKLTLPTLSEGEVTEIPQSELAEYVSKPWFSPTPDCAGVAFRAPVNGATTSGSRYPRSELREMDPDGDLAFWSSEEGIHTLVVEAAFTALPRGGKPHLVGAQIHGSKDDITVFRLEGSNLYVTKGDDSHYKLITSDYALGTRFEAKFVVAGGMVQAFYNGQLVTTIAKDFSKAYFKVGAYTQANCEQAQPCGVENYGETVVYRISVAHT